jgi:hypothetical protein
MHHKVIANQVEAIAIEPATLRVRQPLTQLAVKHQVAQALAQPEVLHGLRQRKPKQRRGGRETLAVLHQDSVCRHGDSFKRRRLRNCFTSMICVLRCRKHHVTLLCCFGDKTGQSALFDAIGHVPNTSTLRRGFLYCVQYSRPREGFFEAQHSFVIGLGVRTDNQDRVGHSVRIPKVYDASVVN